jgi:hypothetical protein
MVSIDIPTGCSKCSHEWVTLVRFFFNNGGGKSIMATCKFMNWIIFGEDGFSGGWLLFGAPSIHKIYGCKHVMHVHGGWESTCIEVTTPAL